MSENLSWNDAILKVLSESDEALTSSEIAERIMTGELRQSFGATPKATVASRISTSITNDGPDSPFLRVTRGEYTTRESALREFTAEIYEDDTKREELHAGGIQALGMYWTRESVVWSRNTKLLGKQQIGADAVDVAGQIGLYLLYDGREVIYVGRSIERPIGIRLFEHTQDRLKARWDRFSWFGLSKILDDGSLTSEIPSLDSTHVIRALEAVLIEALEPRQNRKRGDDFSGIEFIQETDPEIERNRALDILDQMKKRI